jgi:uncharacterized protein with PIN domain
MYAMSNFCVSKYRPEHALTHLRSGLERPLPEESEEAAEEESRTHWEQETKERKAKVAQIEIAIRNLSAANRSGSRAVISNHIEARVIELRDLLLQFDPTLLRCLKCCRTLLQLTHFALSSDVEIVGRVCIEVHGTRHCREKKWSTSEWEGGTGTVEEKQSSTVADRERKGLQSKCITESMRL